MAASTVAMQQVEEYVTVSRARGSSNGEIAKALIDAGWAPDTVGALFGPVDQRPNAPAAATHMRILAGVFAVQSVVVVLGGSVAALRSLGAFDSITRPLSRGHLVGGAIDALVLLPLILAGCAGAFSAVGLWRSEGWAVKHFQWTSIVQTVLGCGLVVPIATCIYGYWAISKARATGLLPR